MPQHGWVVHLQPPSRVIVPTQLRGSCNGSCPRKGRYHGRGIHMKFGQIKRGINRVRRSVMRVSEKRFRRLTCGRDDYGEEGSKMNHKVVVRANEMLPITERMRTQSLWARYGRLLTGARASGLEERSSSAMADRRAVAPLMSAFRR
jgi:hypothetical protein